MSQRYYVTTPIYYVNGAPHIGHAYTSIAADVMARFKRLDGYDVFFLTGTDEHGQKVERAAAEAGLDPQSFTDKVSADFRDMADRMGVSYDDYIRTTEERHKVSCAELWRRIDAAGQIYLGDYEGWYAVRDEAFYDESELTTRPDGTRLRPPGAPVAWVREPSYFFRLSEWQEPTAPAATRTIPTSSCRPAGATRWSVSCAAGCAISRSAAPASAGASRCRARPITSCMSGSTHSTITSPPAAFPTRPRRAGRSGRRTCI